MTSLPEIEAFHGVSVTEVLEEIAYLRDPGDSVIAGGSLAYGLGNQLSDLDLLISGEATGDSSLLPLEHFLGTLRIDVYRVSEQLIDGTFERAAEEFEGSAPLQTFFGNFERDTELKLLHQVAYGVVLDGPGFDLQASDYRTVASRRVVREHVERMRAGALLAQLALRAQRPLAAVVNARLAVEDALNAAIASRGVPFCGDKWLSERLSGDDSDLAGLHGQFLQLPADPDRDAGHFVEEALCSCGEIWGLDLGIARLSREASWHNPGLRLSKVEAGGLLLLPDTGSLWVLDEEEVEAWERLVDLGPGEVGGRWRLEDCDPVARRLCFSLCEKGAMDLVWTRGVSGAELGPRGSS